MQRRQATDATGSREDDVSDHVTTVSSSIAASQDKRLGDTVNAVPLRITPNSSHCRHPQSSPEEGFTPTWGSRPMPPSWLEWRAPLRRALSRMSSRLPAAWRNRVHPSPAYQEPRAVCRGLICQRPHPILAPVCWRKTLSLAREADFTLARLGHILRRLGTSVEVATSNLRRAATGARASLHPVSHRPGAQLLT